MAGEARTAELLLAHGADAATVDVMGFSPLHWAARGGDREVVKLLLEVRTPCRAHERARTLCRCSPPQQLARAAWLRAGCRPGE